MSDDPTPSKTGWVPTVSTVAGGGIGLAIGQFIVALCDQFFHSPIGPELSSAITGICVTGANYLIPDGGRKSRSKDV